MLIQCFPKALAIFQKWQINYSAFSCQDWFPAFAPYLRFSCINIKKIARSPQNNLHLPNITVRTSSIVTGTSPVECSYTRSVLWIPRSAFNPRPSKVVGHCSFPRLPSQILILAHFQCYIVLMAWHFPLMVPSLSSYCSLLSSRVISPPTFIVSYNFPPLLSVTLPFISVPATLFLFSLCEGLVEFFVHLVCWFLFNLHISLCKGGSGNYWSSKNESNSVPSCVIQGLLLLLYNIYIYNHTHTHTVHSYTHSTI